MEKKEKTLHDHFAVIEKMLLTGFAVMLLPIFFESKLWTWVLMFLGFGIMAAACIYRNIYFKCPHCDSKLNVRGVPTYCPDCGEKLI